MAPDEARASGERGGRISAGIGVDYVAMEREEPPHW